ncbi:MAG: amidotransferase [Sulfuriferula multivorans]|uniref:Amidotransferase n=1 Tax=Sulfuriferula multivorans TaxID=1559896 RepID=A0A7C9P8V5_9PROT|nr:amidotransferase [Sulfuriferula multivorans]
MHVHVLQHVPFEGLGSIEAWLSHRGARVTYTRFFEPAKLPALTDINFIIALGGPMSVNDEEQLPWLREEKRFVAEAVASNKAVLGICLGAQLIASALGSRVYPGSEKEIGWFPVFAEPALSNTFVFPASTEVFHWHGETFDLPAGAVHLASSAACRNQAFQIGARVIGLQFHLETTPKSAEAIINNCANELLPQQRYIQTEPALRAVPVANYAGINMLMTNVLEYLVRDGG